MWHYHKLSTWDIAYAVDMAIACLITYCIMIFLLPNITGRPAVPIGTLWAVVSAAFVYRDTRSRSVAAAISRLVATIISLALCLSYLWLFPASAFGMAFLIVIGILLITSLGRPDEIGLTAVTTAIVMIVAANNPESALMQPWLRLIDTVVGIAVGVTCKWIASFMFYKIFGESVQ